MDWNSSAQNFRAAACNLSFWFGHGTSNEIGDKLSTGHLSESLFIISACPSYFLQLAHAKGNLLTTVCSVPSISIGCLKFINNSLLSDNWKSVIALNVEEFESFSWKWNRFCWHLRGTSDVFTFYLKFPLNFRLEKLILDRMKDKIVVEWNVSSQICILWIRNFLSVMGSCQVKRLSVFFWGKDSCRFRFVLVCTAFAHCPQTFSLNYSFGYFKTPVTEACRPLC